MSGLIRPALLLVARLGLFLSIAAWILGQVWSFDSLSFTSPTYSCFLELNSSGWKLDYEVPSPVSLPTHESVRQLPGISFQFANGVYVYVCHWLIVTVFALFYGLVKWKYRKRAIADRHKQTEET